MIEFFVSLILVAFSCKALAESSLKNIRLPVEVIEEIEEDFFQKVLVANPKEERPRELIVSYIPRKGIESAVKFTPLKGKSLNKAFEKMLPALGGQIELSDLLSTQKGTFKVEWSFPEDFISDASLKVLFVPTYQKLPGEKGVACGSYYDLSQFFHKRALKSGIEMTTTDRGYLPVLGGVFVFMRVFSDLVELAVIEFNDERVSNRHCLNLFKEKK